MNEPLIHRIGRTDVTPVVSIIVLNYNGAEWLNRCLGSIGQQTIVNQIEAMLVDNNSSDNSVALAKDLMAKLPMACIVQNKENLGFCEGNNSGARVARGRYLFFLNNDTWLEPDCMEKLIAEVDRVGASAATPWVLNYADDTHQDLGFFGFDIFGLPSPSYEARRTRDIFIPGGCSYLIDARVFSMIGMFDKEFFIYSEEVDLSWRVWIAGYTAVGVPSARVHHRGAAGVNPTGGAKVLEFRTSDKKRFLTNRNCLLTSLKNDEHLLLLTVPLLVVLLFLETIVGCFMLKRKSFFRASFIDVLKDCWRLRHHVAERRRFISTIRRRSDFEMLRFFRLPLNRWFEIKRLLHFGLPRVDAAK